MKGLDYIVQAELIRPLARQWMAGLELAIRQSLARWAVDQIDFSTGLLRQSWLQLDEPMTRAVVVASDPKLGSTAAEILIPDKRCELHQAIEAAAHRNGMSCKQSIAASRASITRLVPTWLSRPEVARLLVSDPFNAGWGFIANEIGRRAHGRYVAWRTAGAADEWQLINSLLLAEYFRQCNYRQARQVNEELDEARHGVMSIRGLLVNTSRRLSPNAVAEAAIPLSGFYGGAVLEHRHQSDLIACVHRESAATAAENGIAHRILGHYTHEVPSRVRSEEVAAANWLLNRRLRYSQFESTILAYMGIASIEQLIRGLAQQQGLNTFKPSGAPIGIPSVLSEHSNLLLPLQLTERVKVLFDSGKGNIRNRIMHGSFLLTHSKRLQANMIAAGITQPDEPPNQDPYTPENIASLTLEVLTYLDREVRGIATVTPVHLDWGNASRLTAADLSFCATLCHDLYPADDSGLDRALALQKELSAYFRVVMPGLGQFFRLGYLTLSEHFSQNTIPLLHALAIIFESTYRLTCHLLGLEIVDKPELKHPDGAVCIQYYMLDSDGLCKATYYDRLVNHCGTHERPNARRVLECAVRARNSLSHGAIVSFDEYTARSTARAMMQAIRVVVAAGIDHLVSVGAWYRWQDLRRFNHGFDQIDWTESERAIRHWIAIKGQPPKV